MGQIVATIAVSHAPGLTGWIDQSPEGQRRNIDACFAKAREALQAARPDVIIGIANDHVLNMPVDAVHDFLVGTAGEWEGPAPWFRDWLKLEPYRVRGHRDLALTLVAEGTKRGIAFASADRLLFDDNWSVPLHYLTPAHDVPLVPIHMNCIVPPLPTMERCYAVGQAIAEIVRTSRPAGERVALLASGGMSHDPGGPKYFAVDEAFDRRFLNLLERGDPARFFKEMTIEQMIEAGDGGTSELLAWVVAMGAVGRRPARTLGYEPAVEMRTGIGAVAWDMSEAS